MLSALHQLKRVRKGVRRFVRSCGYYPNLLEPRSINEKLLVRKLYPQNPLFTTYADKLAVRTFVAEKIGSQYLIPLCRVFSSASQVDLSELPDSYIVKATHGSGWSRVVHSATTENRVALTQQIARWLQSNYTRDNNGELHYENIAPRVIVEQLLTTADGGIPADYKFHCFAANGGVRAVVQVDQDRFTRHARFFFSEKWRRLPFSWGCSDNALPAPDKPENLAELLFVAKTLADPFDYVRVDLYSVDATAYFGELTFVHGSAGELFSPLEWDFNLGELWEMEISRPLSARIKRDQAWYLLTAS